MPPLDAAALLPIAEKAIDTVNPVTSGPSAPLKATAALDAFGASLMPRATMHQGMAAGLATISAGLVGAPVHWLSRQLAPEGSPLAWKLTTRGALAAAGLAATRINETDEEPTQVSTLRSMGELAAAAAIGGMVFETVEELRRRFPARTPLRPVLLGLGAFGYAAYQSGRALKVRNQLVQKWTAKDKPAGLAGSLGVGLAVGLTGRGIGAAFRRSQRATADFFGPDVPHQVIGATVNAALWGAGAVALYNAGVGRIAQANEKVEPGYDKPPENSFVSGGPASISPFEELGLQGRRFVTDVVTPDVIEGALGEPAIAHPVRAYVGMNSEPLYAAGRSEMMLEEMERLGAFERSHLLLFSPTGTGWVDLAVASAAELFCRGDIATVCVQYGRSPSFLALHKVALGRSQFRLLLWGVKQRLAERPPQERPKVLVFGESLGAWSSSDVVMRTGIEGFDHYGIDHALWFGLPGLAKWSRTGMREGHGHGIPEGTVAAFDRFEQYEALTRAEKDRLRAVILDHDNDPIAAISPRLAVKRPPWLDGEDRGRGVPEEMRWIPVLTLTQVLADAGNAMRTVPGEFKSFGHDYRGDTTDFVHAAFQLPAVTADQRDAVEATLTRLEVERGERLKAAKAAGVGSASTEVQ